MSKSNGVVVDVMSVNGKLQAAYTPPESFAWQAPGEIDRSPGPARLPIPDQLAVGWRWAAWGADDLLPTHIRTKIEKVSMAQQAIYRLTAMMYGNGLAYYRNSDLANATDKTKAPRAYIPKVEQWLQRNRIADQWFMPQLADYRFYMNAFSEFVLSRDRSQITGLFHKGAEFSRLSMQNPVTVRTEYSLHSYEFPIGVGMHSDIRRLPLYQWDDEEAFLRRLGGYKFSWHSYFHTPGTIYYARPFWLALMRKNGWLDVAAAVPEVVNAMMRNQISLKYQILIPESYFEIRHPEWQGYTAEARKVLIDALVDTINNSLVGTQNAARTITTIFKQDVSGNAAGKIEIIPIDDKLKSDSWVPSSSTADAQVVQGLGLHPSQLGLAPEGGKMGAGSGSDQRESFNTLTQINTMDQLIVLGPLNFAARYNAQVDPEWDITFFVDHTTHTTTNDQENGLVPGSATLQVQ